MRAKHAFYQLNYTPKKLYWLGFFHELLFLNPFCNFYFVDQAFGAFPFQGGSVVQLYQLPLAGSGYPWGGYANPSGVRAIPFSGFVKPP